LIDFPETVGNVIIPTDWLIFFRGLETTNQCTICLHTNMCILELPVDLYMITYVYMYLYKYLRFFVCVKGQKTYSSSDGYLPICIYIYIHIWLHMYISIKYTYLCIYHVSTYLRCRPDTLIVCCNFDICLFDASASLCMGSLRVGSAKTSNWWFFMFGLVDKWTYTDLTSSSFSVEFCLYATSRQVFWLMMGLDPKPCSSVFFPPAKQRGFCRRCLVDGAANLSHVRRVFSRAYPEQPWKQ
jgi:hypothetical protein